MSGSTSRTFYYGVFRGQNLLTASRRTTLAHPTYTVTGAQTIDALVLDRSGCPISGNNVLEQSTRLGTRSYPSRLSGAGPCGSRRTVASKRVVYCIPCE